MINTNILSEKLTPFNFNYDSTNINLNYIFNGCNNKKRIVLKDITSQILSRYFIIASRIFVATNSSVTNSKIDALMKECKDKNWDYENALPLSTKAVSNAKKFASLIDDIEIPEVIPSPNSDIIFVWKKNGNTMNIIFNAENQVIYVTSKSMEVCSGCFNIDSIKAVLSIVEDFLENV